MSKSDTLKRVFLSYNFSDKQFVMQVYYYLLKQKNLTPYFYEKYEHSDIWSEEVGRQLTRCHAFVLFLGKELGKMQQKEALTTVELENLKKLIMVRMPDKQKPESLALFQPTDSIFIDAMDSKNALDCARKIALSIVSSFNFDDLPWNPHLFSYEKDIINFFVEKIRLEEKENLTVEENEQHEKIGGKILEGCPEKWPEVQHWKENQTRNLLDQNLIGKWRSEKTKVLAAALSKYSEDELIGDTLCENCLLKQHLFFPEAGPREHLFFPGNNVDLNVGILVSGGIAPGINSVIDGITQRHALYADKHGYQLKVFGFDNGFRAFDNIGQSQRLLEIINYDLKLNPRPDIDTTEHANEGGSVLRTSRVEELINTDEPDLRIKKFQDIIQKLNGLHVDILYIIAGDGGMKAAHVLWYLAQEYYDNNRSTDKDLRRLSVVAIPKTMDNDILWVWQSFGFLSAVEKAREVIEHIATEVRSNPRLCIVQLFGSDSGFVVSHALLASRTGNCDVALIPESEFSMKGLAKYLNKRMCERGQIIPYGLVVMAETAIPVDAMDYLNDDDIALSHNEKEAIEQYEKLRKSNKRIQGQTSDHLRRAGLKIVSRGLLKLVPNAQSRKLSGFRPDWGKLRVFTNEPRHVLRAIPPSCLDIINGQRLGTLAVDNALAGYTDFMISQWLTEYVLIPLKLVVLGRKRIPKDGIFWKSVLAKTGQPSDLT